MYIINWEKTDSPLSINFDIMGTTGNIYNTTICDEPKCNCPDFLTRGKRCKHIYFTLIKALKVKIDEADDKSYELDELTKMRTNLVNIYKTDIAKSDAFREEYLKRKDNFIPGKVMDNTVDQKAMDDVCPICLDDFEEYKADEITFCQFSCGANYHKICIEVFKKASQGKFKCALCQNAWNKQCIQLPKYVNMTGVRIQNVDTGLQNKNKKKNNGCTIL
jgi:hypothetical protein